MHTHISCGCTFKVDDREERDQAHVLSSLRVNNQHFLWSTKYQEYSRGGGGGGGRKKKKKKKECGFFNPTHKKEAPPPA